jgi:hypothetical protein
MATTAADPVFVDTNVIFAANVASVFPIGGRQVHDADIVATMQAHGLRRPLTHNAGDFARLATIIDILPL